VQPSPSTNGDTPRALTSLSGITVANGASLTLVAAGLARDTVSARAAGFTPYVDDVSAPAGGQSRLRIINASPDAGAIDVYLTPTGGVRSGTPTFAGVDYRSALTRVSAPGSFAVTITPLSDAVTVLATTNVTLPPGGAQTVIVRGFRDALPSGLPAARRIATTTTVNVSP
jgi:hypothetical protein